jgi:ribonuclease HII
MTLFDDQLFEMAHSTPLPVTMRVRADQNCTSVAAASIVAKVERDAIMRRHAELLPDFGWASNKGYAAPVHREALMRHGPSPFHRASWNLPPVRP